MITFDTKSFIDEIAVRIDAQARELGQTIVQIAKANTPVDTGLLQRSEQFSYNNQTHTLSFFSAAPYDIFVELGTRHSRPHPHWQVAFNAVKSIYGFETEMAFNVPYIHAPIVAHGAGFHLPSTLTDRQRQHVRTHLLPSRKRHFIGNVSRAKLTVKHRGKAY